MDGNILFQGDMYENPTAAIAALNERTLALSRELRELKDAHRAQLEKVERSQEALAQKLDDVLTAMHEARGGWRTLMLMGGTAATLGSGFTWVINHFAGKS